MCDENAVLLVGWGGGVVSESVGLMCASLG